MTAANTLATLGNGPAFSAYQSSAQAISTGTWTKLTIDTEEFDTNNCFASSRFTPTVAGYYHVSGAVGMTTPAGSYIAMYKNGSQFKIGSAANSSLCCAMSCLIYFNGSTDYVDLYTYMGTGQNTSSGQTQTYFQAVLVRGA